MNRWLVCVGFLILGCGAHAEPNRPVAAPGKVVRVQTSAADPREVECSAVVGEVLGARLDAQQSQDPAEGGARMFAKLEALPNEFPGLHRELDSHVLKLSKASTKVLDYVDAADVGQAVDMNEFNATLETALVEQSGLVEYCNQFLPPAE